jgi:hypothetical protein
MSRATSIAALNAKCAKAKRYPRKPPHELDALALYVRAIWDDSMRRGEEAKGFMQWLMRHYP